MRSVKISWYKKAVASIVLLLILSILTSFNTYALTYQESDYYAGSDDAVIVNGYNGDDNYSYEITDTLATYSGVEHIDESIVTHSEKDSKAAIIFWIFLGGFFVAGILLLVIGSIRKNR